MGLLVAVRAQGTTIFERLLILRDDDRVGVRRVDQGFYDDEDGKRDAPAGGLAVPPAGYDQNHALDGQHVCCIKVRARLAACAAGSAITAAI